MARPESFFYLATANDDGTAPTGSLLWDVNVTTSAASAVVTLYNGTTTSDPIIAAIDASAVKTFNFNGVRCPKGLYVKLTAGNAKVTVSYS